MAIVTVCTQVYNTAAYLPQCVESVLKQTFSDFEYIIVDNGSTDGSQDILKEYAKKDPRIQLIRFEENKREMRYPPIAQERGSGQYFTALDSDDWLAPEYLEHLLAFSKKYDLDIACTGTAMHVMGTGEQGLRNTNQEMIFPREAFADRLPWYHVFFRPVWAKLIRMDCLKAVPADAYPKVFHGADTIWAFQMLRRANRMGIDTSILHHYRIYRVSSSYQYHSDRFTADICLYDDAIDFLSAFGPVSAQNRQFLQRIYSNEVTDTLGVIHGSSLAPEDKLREYRTIAAHPLTLAAYRECTHEDAAQSRTELIQKALQAGAVLGTQDDENLRHVMQNLLPHCGRFVSGVNARMFLEDSRLMRILLQDDPRMLLEGLLTRVEKDQGIKKYAIPETIQALASDNILLCQISDAAFLRKYSKIYLLVWKGEYLAALDEMTGLLLGNKVRAGKETFLDLYISLSAVLKQISAFIFGKFQLAQLYFQKNRLPECRAVVSELKEMGVENSEELNNLEYQLKMTQ